MPDWTEEQIDAATRVFCAGLPLETHPEANSLAGMIAKGRCMAPNCNCWEGGRTVTRAALEAATAIHKQPIAELKPHAYAPSVMHMGDCAVCGHLQGAAIHKQAGERE